MTPSSISRMRHPGTQGRRINDALAFERTQTMLDGTVLLGVEEPGYPVLIAGRRFAANFPKARPGASFLTLAEPQTRGRLVAALQSVAWRKESVTVTCVRAGPGGPHWIKVLIEPLLVAPGGPARALGRLMTSETGTVSGRLQVLAVRRGEENTENDSAPQGDALHFAAWPPRLRVVERTP